MKISKRLGGDRTREALTPCEMEITRQLSESRLSTMIRHIIMACQRDPEGQVTYINTETDDVAVNAALVMQAARIPEIILPFFGSRLQPT
jgi:hypothetical protein